MKHSFKVTVLTAAIMLAATSIFAATVSTTNNNNVTATVSGGCQWTTPLTMAFGAYNPLSGAALNQTTTVSFNCVKKTNASDTYSVFFSKTSGNMTDGTDLLAYTLTDNLGNPLPTAGPGTTVSGTPGVGLGTGYTFTVKGSVAGSQNVEVGSYSDTVVATVNY